MIRNGGHNPQIQKKAEHSAKIVKIAEHSMSGVYHTHPRARNGPKSFFAEGVGVVQDYNIRIVI